MDYGEDRGGTGNRDGRDVLPVGLTFLRETSSTFDRQCCSLVAKWDEHRFQLNVHTI